MTEETKQPQVIDVQAKPVEEAPAPEAVKEEVAPEQPLETKPGEQDAVAPKKEEKPAPPPPIKVGYEVGVREDGEFVFSIKGSQPGLVEILGLHTFAGEKIQMLYDRSQVEGQAATALQFNKLYQKFDQTVSTFRDLLNQLLISNAQKPPEKKE